MYKEIVDKIRDEIQTCETEASVRDPEDEHHIQADGYRHIRAMLAAAPEHTATTYVDGRPGHAGYNIQAAPEHTGPTTDWVEVLQAHVDRVLAAEGKLASANVRIAELEAERGVVDLDETLAKLAAANARVAELERENANAWHLRDEAEQRVDAANARADAAEQKLAQSQNVHAQSVKDRGFADIQRRRAESEAAALRDGLNASISANARLETEAATLRAEVARCERSLSERTEQREKAIDRADAAERELQKRPTAEYSAANTRACREAESEAAALRAQLDAANAKYADARDRCIAAQDEMEKLRAAFHETLHDKETELNNLRAEVDALQSEVQMLRDVGCGNVAVPTDSGVLRADLDDASRCYDGALETCAALRAEVEKLRNDPMSKRAYDAESRLSTAIQLLVKWTDTVNALTGAMNLTYLKADTKTFLSTTPHPDRSPPNDRHGAQPLRRPDRARSRGAEGAGVGKVTSRVPGGERMKWYEGRRWYEWAGMSSLLLLDLILLVKILMH